MHLGFTLAAAPRCCTSSPASRCAAAVAAVVVAVAPLADPAAAGVLSKNTLLRRYVTTDAEAVLRYAVPLPAERRGAGEPVPVIREVQGELELLGVDLRARGSAGLVAGRRDLSRVKSMLEKGRLDLLLDVPPRRRAEAADMLSALEKAVGLIENELGAPPPVVSFFPPEIAKMQEVIQDATASRNSKSADTNFDALTLEMLRRDALAIVSRMELLSVEGLGLPYKIPRRYSKMPRLVGRATVEVKMRKADAGRRPEWQDENGVGVGKVVVLHAVLDGYSAPLTSGSFVDLAKRGFYDGTQVVSGERGFYVQLGGKLGAEDVGFIDPATQRRRSVDIEILIDGDDAPSYGLTLDGLGTPNLKPALPIAAYGAMAMVHSVEDPNDASAQFYIFTLDPRSAQARAVGGSALGGTVATFGYVTGPEKLYLSQCEIGDVIESMRVSAGEENFRANADAT